MKEISFTRAESQEQTILLKLLRMQTMQMI